MKIEFNGEEYIVPGCCELIKPEDKKEPYCSKRFNCRHLGDCVWAAEGRRGRHVIDEVPERRRVG